MINIRVAPLLAESSRDTFSLARSLARSCVVFFDELDALCPRRGGSDEGGGGGSGVSERVVNQLLTEVRMRSDRGQTVRSDRGQTVNTVRP